MKIAIDIETDEWIRIISNLKNDGWQIKCKYQGFDAGIDFDFLVLKLGCKRITFGWDNWSQGEIKCSDKLFDFLQENYGLFFKYGKPQNLKLQVIWLTRLQCLIHGW